MKHLREYGYNVCIDEDAIFPQLEYHNDHHDSCSTQMVVSDADDDDPSFVPAEPTHFTGNDAEKAGSFSSHTSNTASSTVFDDPYQDAPLLHDSKEIMARTATKGNINDKTIANPPLFYLTADCKTVSTIKPRNKFCALDSHSKLVDEYEVKYEVKYDRFYEESSKGKDFNACPTRTSTKGIHKNPIDLNLTPDSHKFADSTNGRDSNGFLSNNISNNQTRANLYEQQHSRTHSQHYQTNLCQPQLPHKILSDEDTTINTTMPSKVAPCLPRQRSRAIAIKRSRPAEFVETSDARDNFLDKEAKRCDVELYDYATWRMYNRIIDHRRKNLLRAQHQDDQSQEQQHSSHSLKNSYSNQSNQASSTSTIDVHNASVMLHPSSGKHGQRYFVLNNAAYMGDDYSSNEDEEIFDLEL